jgi:hypothetical protein
MPPSGAVDAKVACQRLEAPFMRTLIHNNQTALRIFPHIGVIQTLKEQIETIRYFFECKFDRVTRENDVLVHHYRKKPQDYPSIGDHAECGIDHPFSFCALY